MLSTQMENSMGRQYINLQIFFYLNIDSCNIVLSNSVALK